VPFRKKGTNPIAQRTKALISAESGLRLLRAFQGMSKKYVNPVQTINFSTVIYFLQVDQKGPDSRPPKSLGVRRTFMYAATTKDEGNTEDGSFSSICYKKLRRK